MSTQRVIRHGVPSTNRHSVTRRTPHRVTWTPTSGPCTTDLRVEVVTDTLEPVQQFEGL